MTTTLDVLVMESIPAAAEEVAAGLARAGHRLHRCYETGERGFPCRGVRDPSMCPIEWGVDVAVLVRPHVAPRPTALETGVSCALRAGIPLVEKGTETLDPFTPWVTARLANNNTGVAETCTATAETALAPLLGRIRQRVARTMTTLAPRRGPVSCALQHHSRGVRVELSGPRLGKDTEHALAVRVADAVSAERRSFATIDVTYHARA
jgi:hypothetical protein